MNAPLDILAFTQDPETWSMELCLDSLAKILYKLEFSTEQEQTEEPSNESV